MSDGRKCVQCGADLPADALQGHCPACVVRFSWGENAEDSPLAILRYFGDYELLEEIARGGMGVVYKARQASLNRIVAVKMILAGQLASDADVNRFRSEAEAAANLKHPNIVAIHEVGEHESQHYFSMDFIEGRSLAALVRDGPLPAQRAARYVQLIAEAIHYAHERGTLHRDLKPSNVLIDAHDQPQVTDFGLAKQFNVGQASRLPPAGFQPAKTSAASTGGTPMGAGETPALLSLTLSGQILGSPNFMPPEQAGGHRGDIGPHSDIYGLGAILYHLLTARPPFVADTVHATLRLVCEAEPVSPHALNPGIPRDLDTICLKCLEKDPQRRYRTARELAEELSRFLSDQPIHARPVSHAEKLWRWCRRNPRVAGLSASLVLAVVAGFAGVLAQLQRAERLARQQIEARQEAEEFLRQVEMQRVEELLAADNSTAALALLGKLLRRHPDDFQAAHRVVWELGRRNFVLPLAPALAHREYVRTARFSSDGRRVVTSSRDGTARVWNARTGEALTNPLVHDAEDVCAVLSPDGEQVLTSSSKGMVQLWNAQTGEALLSSLRHGAEVHWVEFSPDGQRFVTASSDHLARICDTRTGQTLIELAGHTGTVVYAEFSGSGEHIVTASQDQTARLWSARTGQMVGPALQHPAGVKRALFSADSQRIGTFAKDGAARIWPAGKGRLILEPLRHESEVTDLAFSPDGQRLLTASWDKTAQLWDARTGAKLTPALRHGAGVTAARFDPSGDRVVTAAWDGTARIWNGHTGRPLTEAFRQGSGMRWVEFSPDGQCVATASRDHSAQLWDVRASPLAPAPLRHTGPVVSAALSPDGRWLATAARDYSVRLWNVRTGEPAAPPWPHEPGAIGLCFGADSTRLATTTQSGATRLWEVASGRLVTGPFRYHQGASTGLISSSLVIALSPDGGTLVTCAYDGQNGAALLWHARSGKQLTPPLAHAAWVGVVEFSPDGRKLATGAWDKTARVWDAQTGAPLTGPLRHQENVSTVDFSSDGRWLLTASIDHTARIWDSRTGQPVIGALRLANYVQSARFSPDDRWVVTACNDGTAQIWDAQTGQPRHEPLRHDAPLTSAKFSPNGKWVLTLAEDQSARVWIASNSQPATASLKWEGKIEAAEFLGDGVRVAIAFADHVVRIWEVPLWETPTPNWLASLAEAVGGQRVGPQRLGEPVPVSEFLALKQTILASPATDGCTRWMQWFVSDPATRAVTPFSSSKTR